MKLRIERATEPDIPAISRLVRQLAEYEKLAHAMVSSEDDFREALFGPKRNVDALMAFADEAAVGFALYFHNFSTSWGSAAFIWKIFTSNRNIAAGASAARC